MKKQLYKDGKDSLFVESDDEYYVIVQEKDGLTEVVILSYDELESIMEFANDIAFENWKEG